MRDSEKTKRKILNAVGDLLSRKGFRRLGINSIARQAGVDKVLIYRYFGGLEGLLREFSLQSDYWPGVDDLLGGERPPADGIEGLASAVMRGWVRELRKRKTTQEILIWELMEKNGITEQLARLREDRGAELMGLMPHDASVVRGRDIEPAIAIMVAGITYLVLRSRMTGVYAGVPLDEEGWKRIEAAVDEIIRAYLRYRPEK